MPSGVLRPIAQPGPAAWRPAPGSTSCPAVARSLWCGHPPQPQPGAGQHTPCPAAVPAELPAGRQAVRTRQHPTRSGRIPRTTRHCSATGADRLSRHEAASHMQKSETQARRRRRLHRARLSCPVRCRCACAGPLTPPSLSPVSQSHAPADRDTHETPPAVTRTETGPRRRHPGCSPAGDTDRRPDAVHAPDGRQCIPIGAQAAVSHARTAGSSNGPTSASTRAW